MENVTNEHGQVTTRRTFLKQMLSLTGASATAALLAACGASATTATAVPTAQQPTTAPTAAQAPTTAATAAGPASDATAATAVASGSPVPSVVSTAATAGTAAPTAGATAPTAGATVAAGQSATPQIVAAANAFLATLDDSQKSSVLFEWSNTEQKQRWSNLPQGLFERAGLRMGDLSEAQQNASLAVLQAILSTEGYNRVIAEWTADDQLVTAEGSSGTPSASGTSGIPSANGTSGTPGTGGPSGTPGAGGPSGTPGTGGPSGTPGAGGGGGGGGGQLLYGRQYYWVAIIGTPSETSAWQYQWGGHHVTVNATIVGSNLSLMPSFIGVQPGEYTDSSGNTVRPLGDIDDEAFALVNSLDTTQQGAAVLGDTVIDLVLGPGQDGKTIQSEGLPASQMTADQKAAFLKLIAHYTGLANDAVAAARLAEITTNLDQTYFAWYGPTTAGSSAYFRATGPTIVIEYSPQGGGGTGTGLGGSATKLHVHGIYRDPTNDYGAKYTA